MLKETTTCVPCRQRKVKCDGLPGKCSPCQKSKSNLHCTYAVDKTVKTMTRRGFSKNGESCGPCKLKKKKCDLGRPCETCVNAKKTDLCKYHKPKSPERPNHLRWIEPARKRRVSPSSSDTEIFESSPGSSTSTLWKSSPPPVPPVYFDLIDPSYVLHLNDLLRNMRLSESSLAMSKVSLADLELNFRLTFLTHRAQCGFRFTLAKQHAFLVGQLHNPILPPFFIHFAHMFGVNVYQEQRQDYSHMTLMNKYLEQTKAALLDMREEHDPLSFAQACFFMFYAYMYNHNRRMAKHYFAIGAKVIKRHQIRLVTSNSPPVLTEEEYERIAFLAEMCSSEVDLVLVSGGLAPLLGYLLSQFEVELPNVYPELFKTCRNTMRVVSILSAQQGATLLTTHKSHSVNTPAWFEACRKFLSESATNIADLAALINRNHANQNPQACVSLQYSAFSYRITLGLLWEKLSRDVLHADLYRQCEARFYEVVEILNAMSKEDRAFLNQFIDMCWARAFAMFGGHVDDKTMAKSGRSYIRYESIFSNASTLVMCQSPNKIASAVLEWPKDAAYHALEARGFTQLLDGRWVSYDRYE